MKRIIILFLLFSTVTYSQEITWEQEYDHGLNEIAHSLIQTSDGGFAYIVNTILEDSVVSGQSVVVVKTNDLGDVIWTLNLQFSSTQFGYGLVESASGYVVTGRVVEEGSNIEANSNIFLCEINDSGEVLWFKQFGEDGFDQSRSIDNTQSGGYILVGSKEDSMCVLNINYIGDSVWSKVFSVDEGELNGEAVCATTDGGYIVCGHLELGGGDNKLKILKLDNNGDVLWSHNYGVDVEGGMAVPSVQVVELFNQDIAIAFMDDISGNQDVFVTIVNENGEYQNEYQYDIGDYDSNTSIDCLGDEGLIIGGNNYDQIQEQNIAYISKINNNGSQVWTLSYEDAAVFSIIQTDQGEYMGLMTVLDGEDYQTKIFRLVEEVIGISEENVQISSPELLDVVDIIGRKSVVRPYQPYIEIYDDGSIIKKILVE